MCKAPEGWALHQSPSLYRLNQKNSCLHLICMSVCPSGLHPEAELSDPADPWPAAHCFVGNVSVLSGGQF